MTKKRKKEKKSKSNISTHYVRWLRKLTSNTSGTIIYLKSLLSGVLMAEIKVPGGNNRSDECHWHTLSQHWIKYTSVQVRIKCFMINVTVTRYHNIGSSTPQYRWELNVSWSMSLTHVITTLDQVHLSTGEN